MARKAYAASASGASLLASGVDLTKWQLEHQLEQYDQFRRLTCVEQVGPENTTHGEQFFGAASLAMPLVQLDPHPPQSAKRCPQRSA